MKKPLPPLVFLVSIVLMLVLRTLAPIVRIVPEPYTLLGIIVTVTGLTITVSSAKLFARVGTNIKTFDDPGTLVTSGPFRYTRNPMYLGFVTALLGIAVLLGTLSPFLLVIAFFLLSDRWYIPFEESRLAATFGSSYDDYRNRVRRWI